MRRNQYHWGGRVIITRIGEDGFDILALQFEEFRYNNDEQFRVRQYLKQNGFKYSKEPVQLSSELFLETVWHRIDSPNSEDKLTMMKWASLDDVETFLHNI